MNRNEEINNENINNEEEQKIESKIATINNADKRFKISFLKFIEKFIESTIDKAAPNSKEYNQLRNYGDILQHIRDTIQSNNIKENNQNKIEKLIHYVTFLKDQKNTNVKKFTLDKPKLKEILTLSKGVIDSVQEGSKLPNSVEASVTKLSTDNKISNNEINNLIGEILKSIQEKKQLLTQSATGKNQRISNLETAKATLTQEKTALTQEKAKLESEKNELAKEKEELNLKFKAFREKIPQMAYIKGSQRILKYIADLIGVSNTNFGNTKENLIKYIENKLRQKYLENIEKASKSRNTDVEALQEEIKKIKALLKNLKNNSTNVGNNFAQYIEAIKQNYNGKMDKKFRNGIEQGLAKALAKATATNATNAAAARITQAQQTHKLESELAEEKEKIRSIKELLKKLKGNQSNISNANIISTIEELYKQERIKVQGEFDDFASQLISSLTNELIALKATVNSTPSSSPVTFGSIQEIIDFIQKIIVLQQAKTKSESNKESALQAFLSTASSNLSTGSAPNASSATGSGSTLQVENIIRAYKNKIGLLESELVNAKAETESAQLQIGKDVNGKVRILQNQLKNEKQRHTSELGNIQQRHLQELAQQRSSFEAIIATHEQEKRALAETNEQLMKKITIIIDHLKTIFTKIGEQPNSTSIIKYIKSLISDYNKIRTEKQELEKQVARNRQITSNSYSELEQRYQALNSAVAELERRLKESTEALATKEREKAEALRERNRALEAQRDAEAEKAKALEAQRIAEAEKNRTSIERNKALAEKNEAMLRVSESGRGSIGIRGANRTIRKIDPTLINSYIRYISRAARTLPPKTEIVNNINSLLLPTQSTSSLGSTASSSSNEGPTVIQIHRQGNGRKLGQISKEDFQRQLLDQAQPQVQASTFHARRKGRGSTLGPSHGGGSKMVGGASEVELIDIFYNTMNQIINSPSIIKLSALSVDEIIDLFIGNDAVTFTIETPIAGSSGKTAVLKNSDVLSYITDMLFVDITEWMKNMYQSYTLNSRNQKVDVVIGPESTGQGTYVQGNTPTDILRFLRQEHFKDEELFKVYSDTINMHKLLSAIDYCKTCDECRTSSVCRLKAGEQIQTIENNKIYINIFKFMEILDIVYKVSKNLLRNQDISYRVTLRDLMALTIEENYMLSQMTKLYYMAYTIMLIEVYEKNVRDKIDQLYLKKTTNNIITYLRIRCDKTNGSLNTYNKRFDIKVNNNNTLLNIGYIDHDFPYYDVDRSGHTILHPNLQTNINDSKYNSYYNQTPSYLSTSTPVSFKPTNYQYKYKIGPFNKVFSPTNGGTIVNNPDISRYMNEIMENLQKNKTVFVLGYGASGSGKTSSLIYFNQADDERNKNGILITLCNQFASTTDYKNIDLISYEFYSKEQRNSYNKDNIEIKYVPKKSETGKRYLRFGYDTSSKQFILNGTVNGTAFTQGRCVHENTFTDRTKKYRLTTGLVRTNESGANTAFEERAPMGQVLIHIIDSDRYVKATPNNPNSSRSHALVVIKFKKMNGEAGPTLIIGDFAGVENSFDCGDMSTLKSFSDVRIDGDRRKNKFYTTFSKSIPTKETPGVANTPSLGCIDYKEDVYFPCELTKFRTLNNPDHYNDKLNVDNKINLIFETNRPSYTNYLNPSRPISGNRKTDLETIDRNKLNILQNKDTYKAIEIAISNLVNNNNQNYSLIYNKATTDEIFNSFRDKAQDFKKMISFLELKPIFNTTFELLKRSAGGANPSINDIFITNFVKNIITTKTGDNYLDVNLPQTFNVNDYIILYEDPARKRFFVDELIARIHSQLSAYSNKTLLFIQLIKDINESSTYTMNDFVNFKKIKNKPVITTNKRGAITSNHRPTPSGSYPSDSKHMPYTEPLLVNSINGIIETISIQTPREIFNMIKNNYFSNLTLFNILTTGISGSNTINKLVQFLNRYTNEEINNLIKTLKYMYISTMENYIELYCRIKKSTEICELRKNEGYMINGTLQETRQIIQDLILTRNKNSIRVVPPFNNDCLPYYCVDNTCFNQNRLLNNITSKIFTETLKPEIGETNFNNMIISIFMVLNISPLANNPPPIPYIDIYKLNRLIYKIKNNEKYNITRANQIITELYESIEHNFHRKNTILITQREFYNFHLLYQLFKKTPGVIDKNEMFNRLGDLITFKNLIDNNNAATSIGTLEFLDLVSKYYTTNLMCKPTNTNKNISEYKDILHQSVVFVGGKKNIKSKSIKSKSVKSKSIKSIKKNKNVKSKSIKRKSVKSKNVKSIKK